uniref:Three-finger toxin n=1 Tax=Calliophis bivirgatus TaxID=8633 RepID=A0A898INK0_CALBG|nr:three-finger toxin [Calliophis bivirgatus]
MKTLLLTFVVVTFLCLDLGYTRKCCSYQSSTRKTTKICPDGEDVCYGKTSVGPSGPVGRTVLELGCAATCPSRTLGVNIRCCKKDKCNCG